MPNLWDDDQNEEFRDIPDETKLDVSGQPLQAPPVQAQVRAPRVNIPANAVTTTEAAYAVGLRAGINQDVDLEQLGIDEENDFTAVLNDANLRIEQGRLYQMIMNHDLFEGMDADPRAVQNVQSEMRKYARERMEIMLGMRQEQVAPVSTISSSFNDLELDILKKIASKATNGATESPEANQVAAAVREVPKRQTLNPIGGSTAPKRPSAPKPQAKLPSKAVAPVQRTRNDASVEQILREEGVPRELVEENYVGIGKPINQLTAEELAQRQKESSQRLSKRTTVKSSSALPMASPEQQALLAMQRAEQIGQSPGMAALLEKVKSMPIKNP